MESDSEFLSDIAYDLFCQSSHLSARSSAIVHQDQSLMLIDTYCTGAMPFVSALLDQPSGRNFHAAIRLRLAWYGGIFGLQGIEFLGGYHRIYEEAARIAYCGRIGQLGIADAYDRISNRL